MQPLEIIKLSPFINPHICLSFSYLQIVTHKKTPQKTRTYLAISVDSSVQFCKKFFVKFSASLPVSQLSASKLHCHYPCDTSLFCLFGLEDPMSGISSQSVTVLTNINFRDYFSWVLLLLYSLTSCNILNLMMKEAGKRGMFQSEMCDYRRSIHL